MLVLCFSILVTEVCVLVRAGAWTVCLVGSWFLGCWCWNFLGFVNDACLSLAFMRVCLGLCGWLGFSIDSHYYLTVDRDDLFGLRYIYILLETKAHKV